MIRMIEDGGPMHDRPLSDMRATALMALDEANLKLPPAVIAYLQALEASYVSQVHRQTMQFLRQSWDDRAAPASPSSELADGK